MTEMDHDTTEPETIDTGQPIAMLRDREEPASDGFMGSLRRRIQRRLLAADVGRLSWIGPIVVVVEILNMIFSLFGSTQADNTEER